MVDYRRIMLLASLLGMMSTITGCDSDQPRMVTETAEQSFDDLAEQAVIDTELSEAVEE